MIAIAVATGSVSPRNPATYVLHLGGTEMGHGAGGRLG